MASKDEHSQKSKETTKLDTKYYDDLFRKLDEDEDTEILYENVIEQMAETEVELKKCASSYFVDYFIYKSKLKHFCKVFQLITESTERLNNLLSDVKTSRIYEACLICAGEKLKKAAAIAKKAIAAAADSEDYNKVDDVEDESNRLKGSFENLGKYLNDNFMDILDTQNGIFTLRTFLRVIGRKDLLPTNQNETNNSSGSNKLSSAHFNNKTNNNKKTEFNLKDIMPVELPEEWGLDKYIKKISAHLKELNVLELGLHPTLSPCLSLIMRKLKASYGEKSEKIIKNVHEQLAKKKNSFTSMIQDSIGSRFIESFLLVCPQDILAHYFDEFLTPNLAQYSNHIYANYPIQTLLKYRKSEEIKPLYEGLLENLSGFINFNSSQTFRHYILFGLVDLALEMPGTFDLTKLVDVICDLLGCNSTENKTHIIRLLLVFKDYETVEKEGSGVDQALFSFDLKPSGSTLAGKLMEADNKDISKSFNSLNANEIEYLCTNNVGSHFIQKCLNIFHKKDRNVWLQTF